MFAIYNGRFVMSTPHEIYHDAEFLIGTRFLFSFFPIPLPHSIVISRMDGFSLIFFSIFTRFFPRRNTV